MPDPGYTFLPSSRSYTISGGPTPTLNWYRVRKDIIIQNTGANDVYIGFWSNVTTSGDGAGVKLAPGAVINFTNPHSSATFNSPVYMISPDGTTALVIEVV